MQQKWKLRSLNDMRKWSKLLSMACFIICSFNTKAQVFETNPDLLRTTFWYFGEKGSLFLSNDTVVELSNGKTNHWEGTAVAVGQKGNLHFYSDGINIWNSSGVQINSGNLLLGRQSATQTVSVVPAKSSDSTYHIFTNTDVGGAVSKSYYYKAKFSNNYNSVKLIKELIQLNGTEKGNTLFHQNKRDVWYVSHMYSGANFYSFLVKDSVKVCCPVYTAGNTKYNIDIKFSSVGQLKFSNNGSLMVDAICNPFENKTDLYAFDQENGTIQLDTTLNIFRPYGASFDIDGKVLYLSNTQGKLYKYSTIDKSLSEVSSNLEQDITGLQLTYNFDILISEPGKNSLSIIDSGGNFVKDSIKLNHGRSNYSLPNFNASYFYTPSIDFAYTEDCWGHTYSFEGRDTLKATSWKWYFVKDSIRDSVLSKHCDYTFSDTGRWEVSHLATNGARTDTVTKTLTIRPKWEVDMLGKDTFYCTGDSIHLDLVAPPDMHCVHWGDNQPVEEPNLDADFGPIIDYDHFHKDTLTVDTAGVYVVKVTNKTFCQTYDTLTIREYPKPSKSAISRFNDSIVSNRLAHIYRWYRDGVPQLETSSRNHKPDSNGIWQVQLVSEQGCESELSDSLLVDFVSIKPLTINNLPFKVYPNPSNGHFFVKAGGQKSEVTIRIFDLNGKLVHAQQSNNSEQIAVHTHLATGNYTLRLTDNKGNSGSQMITVR